MNDLSNGLCFEVKNLGIIRGGEFTANTWSYIAISRALSGCGVLYLN